MEERYTYKAMDDDKYIVIDVQDHCSIIQENDDVIRKIQEFDELNPERMRSLQKQISKHKTYEVQLGIYKEKRKMDKDKYVEKVLNQSIPPLIPYKLVDEYGDFINDEMRNVVRANCLRRYLEGAIDLLIKDKVLAAGLPEEKWNNYNLNNRIQAIGKDYSKRME